MDAVGFARFDTAIGVCSIAWGPRGIVGVGLPALDGDRFASTGPAVAVSAWPAAGAQASVASGLPRRFAGVLEIAPPPAVAAAIAAIVALLDGEGGDLVDVELDLDGVPDFHRRVYAVARRIPPGRTLTYGEVAARLGDPGAAQAVGQALGRNPFPIVVPCHRVLAADGFGGFSAPGGVHTKRRLLAIEGAPGFDQPALF